MLLKELKEAKSVEEANKLLSSGEWVCISQHVINDNITYIFGKYDFSSLSKVEKINNRSKKYKVVTDLPRKRI